MGSVGLFEQFELRHPLPGVCEAQAGSVRQRCCVHESKGTGVSGLVPVCCVVSSVRDLGSDRLAVPRGKLG